MDSQLRTRAEARLEEAAGALGLADPRPPYRERLRHLREARPDAFQRAIAHYESVVLPAMADQDALHAWLEYGRFLATLSGDGDVQLIDESGLARAFNGQSVARHLVLFVPRESSEQVLILAQPSALSDAQRATIDLLVARRLSIGSGAGLETE